MARTALTTRVPRHRQSRRSKPHRLWPLLPSIRCALVAILLLAGAAARPVDADVQPEKMGQVERLEQPFHAHWVWVSDLVLERAALMDLDSGRFLGMVNGGYGTIMPLFPAHRPEIYIPATYYSRRNHGERTDVVEIYDTPTL